MNYLDKFLLKGKKAIITGGAGLVGWEIVTALAQAKAKVVIADVNRSAGQALEKALRQKKLDVTFVDFDITDLLSLEHQLKNTVKKIGGLDIFVNSAYPRTADFGKKVEDISVTTWRENVDIQLNAYALSSKFAAQQMKKHGGSIINLGSIYGVVGPDFTVYENTKMTNPMIYAAVKGGIVNLGRYMASYFGPYNIRVNTVCPGGVFDQQNPVFVKNYCKKTPLKRMAKKDEIAPAVLFLASDAASYITGTTVMVDGGWTAV